VHPVDELDELLLLLELLLELELLDGLLDELLELLVEHAAQLSTVIVSPCRWPMVKLTVGKKQSNAIFERSKMTISPSVQPASSLICAPSLSRVIMSVTTPQFRFITARCVI
jgi:hypothetical protein